MNTPSSQVKKLDLKPPYLLLVINEYLTQAKYSCIALISVFL